MSESGTSYLHFLIALVAITMIAGGVVLAFRFAKRDHPGYATGVFVAAIYLAAVFADRLQ